MATAGRVNPRTAFQAASASRRLLNDSSLPPAVQPPAPPSPAARAQSVGGGSLLWVLTVTQAPRQAREGDLRGHSWGSRRYSVTPRRKPPWANALAAKARFRSTEASPVPQIVQRGVVRRVGQHDDPSKILGSGADHGRATNVDLLQRVAQRDG